MGFGFGFNLGPFRAGGSFRGPGATDEEWASLVVVVLWITVPVFIFQVVLEFLTDPYFWFVMLVGCLPSVTWFCRIALNCQQRICQKTLTNAS